MKACPICSERFDDEMKFCTFDGAPLRLGVAPDRTIQPDDEPQPLYAANPWKPERRNGWKVAFFVLLAINLVAAGAGVAYWVISLQNRPAPPPLAPSVAGGDRNDTPLSSPQPQPTPERVSLAELSRQELMESLPRNLLRRFHAGEPGQGLPDDLRVIAGQSGEYVVLIGSGRIEGASRTPAERMLILRYEENEFKDVTRQSLPAAYASGAVAGRQAQVRFDETGVNLLISEPASSSSIVQECASCDHAYQLVTLEWKGVRYAETSRAWENDRYSVFYATADALERKKVDHRARSVIDRALDPIISQGFARNGKEGWTVEWRGDEESDTASYELSNGAESLIITLSRLKGQWRAIQIVRRAAEASNKNGRYDHRLHQGPLISHVHLPPSSTTTEIISSNVASTASAINSTIG